MTEVTPSALQTPPDSPQEQTPASAAPSAALTEDQVKNHPLFKELEGKASAAEREKDRFKGRLEKARQGILEEDQPQEKPKEVVPYATKEELWEIKNAKALELYGDEQFSKDVSAGIPRDYALETARLRFQSNPDKARIQRQQTMASGPSSSDRMLPPSDVEITDKDRQDAKDWNYSEETIRRHKELKRARGQL